MVEGGGFEPPKAEPSDLQSDPFGHSGTPPRGHHINNIDRIWSLAMSYSHMGTPTLPSAQLRFTSEFGMGSGGATVLLLLDKNFYLLNYLLLKK
jgi:hypothetical protein